jgi:hypothetical protein
MSSLCSWTSWRIRKKSSVRRESETVRPFAEGSLRSLNRGVDLLDRGEVDLAGLHAERRVVDRPAPARGPFEPLAVYPVRDSRDLARTLLRELVGDPRSHRQPSARIASMAVEQGLDAKQIQELDKQHVLHSWSVQNQISPLPVAGAEGRYFWDHEGNRYLDFASQLVNVNLGHQHPKVVAAIVEQAEKLTTIGPPMAHETRSSSRACSPR